MERLLTRSPCYPISISSFLHKAGVPLLKVFKASQMFVRNANTQDTPYISEQSSLTEFQGWDGAQQCDYLRSSLGTLDAPTVCESFH